MSTCAILQETIANRDLVTNVLLTEIQTLVEPLRRLDERTRASIMVLVGLAELVTAHERPRPGGHESLAPEFARSLLPMHGEAVRLLTQLRTTRRGDAGQAASSPLDALMDVLRCLGLPAPVPYERRRTVRSLTDLPPCLCDAAAQRPR
jgi:hypothetical protein